jgi:hypothetical protein
MTPLFFKRTLLLPILLSATIHLTGQVVRFQQRVDHHLTIELDDVRHVVIGRDSIIYHNRSGESLSSIWFHLWPNALKPGSPLSEQMLQQGNDRLHHADKHHTGDLSGLLFRVNGRPTRWIPDTVHAEFLRLDLPSPLHPDSIAVITVLFRLTVPGTDLGELGHQGQAYFLSNWFPRPVVFNDHGWQLTPHYLHGVQPGETGNFDVTVTVPKNYVVVTSGRLDSNPEEEKWLLNLAEKTGRINRWGKRESARFPASVAKTKTLRFTREEASNFAICLDKRFQYMTDTMMTGVGEQARRIDLHLYFTVFEAEHWSKSMAALKEALRFMESQVGTYPYEDFTMIQTSWIPGQQAYPALIRVGSVPAPYLLESAMMHAVAQHWFGVSLVFDAYRYPWLHNGLAGYYAIRHLRKIYPDTLSMQDLLLDPGVKRNIAGLKGIPVTRIDHLKMDFLQQDDPLPLSLTADHYAQNNQLSMLELKSAFAFSTLCVSLGRDVFAAMIQDFYAEYQGRNPSYATFLQHMEQVAGSKTSAWFFSQMIHKGTLPDYRICSVRKNREGYLLKVRNVSGVEIPFPISGESGACSNQIWFPGHAGKVHIQIPDTGHRYTSLTIDKGYIMPEVNRKDNTIRTKGLFRKVERIAIVPFAGVPDPSRTQLGFAPVVGWNHTNGFMVGIASYSNPILRPATEYLIMPLYGIRNMQFAGMASLVHHFKPQKGIFSRIDLGAEVKQYGYDTRSNPSGELAFSLSYMRIAPFVEFLFRKTDPVQSHQHRVRFRTLLLSMEQSDPAGTTILDAPRQLYLNELAWKYRSNKVINPFRLEVTFQQANDMMRLMAEEHWVISYPAKQKGFSIRAFAGVFLLSPSGGGPFQFTSSGVAMNTRAMFNLYDPLFDHLYLARNDVPGILKQHMVVSEGGFKRATTIGNNDRWMFAVNMATTLPGRLPFQLYLDAGIFADAGEDQFFKGLFLYSSGLKMNIIKDVVEIYFPFPFFESKEIAEREALNQLDLNYFQKIRFVVNFQHLNPLTLPRKISLK